MLRFLSSFPKSTLAFTVVFFLSLEAFAAKPYTLTVKYADCLPQKLMLYEFDGIGFTPIQINDPKDSIFTFVVETDSPIMYFVGQQPNVIKPVIFGLDKKMAITPTCRKIGVAKFPKGSINDEMTIMLQEASNFQQKEQAARKKAAKNGDKLSLKKELKIIDTQKLAWLKAKKAIHPYLGKMARLSTLLSFANDTDNYGSELEYFAREYFHFVDFKDPTYNNIPMVFDAFRNYASTLPKYRAEPVLMQVYIEELLESIPENSKAYRLALGGATMAFRTSNKELFAYFGKKFIKKYETKKPQPTIYSLKKMLTESNVLAINTPAPDFTMNDTEGVPRTLSEFQGKVLLIDFWASWCGPCRRENPNVKRLYAKYHDKGFDILGVSLDKKKDRWLGAIQKDGLPWNHVSDLRGWSCSAARLYKVRSIPATFLLDPKGNIIAKGLRGPALEQKLVEIFGE